MNNNKNKYGNEIAQLQLIKDRSEIERDRFMRGEGNAYAAQKRAIEELFAMVGDLAGFMRNRFAEKRDADEQAEQDKPHSDYLSVMQEGKAGRVHLHDGEGGTCIVPRDDNPGNKQVYYRVGINGNGRLSIFTLFLKEGEKIGDDGLREKEWNQAAIDAAGENFYILTRKEAE